MGDYKKKKYKDATECSVFEIVQVTHYYIKKKLEGCNLLITFDESPSIGDIISVIYSIKGISHSIEKVIMIKSYNGVTAQRDISYYIDDPVRLINYFNNDNDRYEETNIHYTENQTLSLNVVFVSQTQALEWNQNIRIMSKKKILEDILKKYKQILNK